MIYNHPDFKTLTMHCQWLMAITHSMKQILLIKTQVILALISIMVIVIVLIAMMMTIILTVTLISEMIIK